MINEQADPNLMAVAAASVTNILAELLNAKTRKIRHKHQDYRNKESLINTMYLLCDSNSMYTSNQFLRLNSEKPMIFLDSKESASKLCELITEHKKISFAVAWAGRTNPVLDSLKRNYRKIQEGTIGTHFHQTHWKVLQWARNKSKIKFIFDTDSTGVFHPKIYMFQSDDKWDILIGSANLTKGGMESNTELMVHISDADGDFELFRSAEHVLGQYFKDAQACTFQKYRDYKEAYIRKERQDKRAESIIYKKSRFQNLSWSDYYEKILRSTSEEDLEEACKLLRLIRKDFQKTPVFGEMDEDIRRAIAGSHPPKSGTYKKINIGYFGFTKANGDFTHLVLSNEDKISLALDRIPSVGKVTKSDYMDYIELMISAYKGRRENRHGLGVFMRLPAMKRPDIFVPWNNRNEIEVHRLLSIKPKIKPKQYERYWHEVALKIHNSDWYESQRPSRGLELKIWEYRAAMFDFICYR